MASGHVRMRRGHVRTYTCDGRVEEREFARGIRRKLPPNRARGNVEPGWGITNNRTGQLRGCVSFLFLSLCRRAHKHPRLPRARAFRPLLAPQSAFLFHLIRNRARSPSPFHPRPLSAPGNHSYHYKYVYLRRLLRADHQSSRPFTIHAFPSNSRRAGDPARFGRTSRFSTSLTVRRKIFVFYSIH